MMTGVFSKPFRLARQPINPKFQITFAFDNLPNLLGTFAMRTFNNYSVTLNTFAFRAKKNICEQLQKFE
jgi:hypothetical protein